MAAAFAPDNNNIVGIFQSFVYYSVYSPIFRLHDVGGADVGLLSPLRHLVVHNNALIVAASCILQLTMFTGINCSRRSCYFAFVECC